MRRPVPLLCLSILGLLAIAGGPAAAQVTVDLHALDNAPAAHPPEQGAAPAHKPPAHHAPHHSTRTTHAPARPTARETEKPAAPKPPAGPVPPTATQAPASKPAIAAPAPPITPTPVPPAPVVGLAPPPAVVIPAPAPADAPMPPPPPPPISATAGTTVVALPKAEGTGVRLDFTGTEADLTPASIDAVKTLVAATPQADTTSFNVLAYATGTTEDPSAARRLSLSRALAVRSALIADGVPSTRIYVRALGAPPPPGTHPTATGAEPPGGPADRVDVIVFGANAASPPAGGAPPTRNP